MYGKKNHPAFPHRDQLETNDDSLSDTLCAGKICAITQFWQIPSLQFYVQLCAVISIQQAKASCDSKMDH